MCPNKATVRIKTLHGWYFMCSICLMNGHMLVSTNDADKFPTNKYVIQCECEHVSHMPNVE